MTMDEYFNGHMNGRAIGIKDCAFLADALRLAPCHCRGEDYICSRCSALDHYNVLLLRMKNVADRIKEMNGG